VAAQIQPVVHQAPAPYGVVFLSELMAGETDKRALLLPITFVYLLSMHVRFIVPVAEKAIPVVESILDEVLAGHSLQSKGLVYQAVKGAELDELVESATLLITSGDDTAFDQASTLPQAAICQQAGKGPNVRLRNVDRIVDEGLKAKLVGCAQLINIQSGGFLSEGHFSLSW